MADSPGSLVFLFAAMLVTWAVLFLYLVFLGGRVTALRRDLETLEDRIKQESGVSSQDSGS